MRIERHHPSVRGWSYKAKIHLKLDLAVSVKGCKKAFNRHISKKERSREIPTAEWAMGLGDKGMEKAKIMTVSFAVVCADDI